MKREIFQLSGRDRSRMPGGKNLEGVGFWQSLPKSQPTALDARPELLDKPWSGRIQTQDLP
jgi:hypothetical protein